MPAVAKQSGSMDHGNMTHDTAQSDFPRQGGQAAFAAIAEIVAGLVADPATDWNHVDIEALRQLVSDLDNVTLCSKVAVMR